MSRKEIKKAVLSRHRHIEPSGSFRWAAVFSTGCKIRFGFCFVGQCARVGRWIGATPETLLDCDGVSLTTMALAGTRKAWERRDRGDKKEQEEQQIVIRLYIEDI